MIYNKIVNSLTSEILYGIHPIALALKAKKRQCIKLFVKKSFIIRPRPIISNILQLANQQNIYVSLIDDKMLDKLSNKGQHQGVCMEVSKLEICEHDFDSIVNNKLNLWVALESIYDPMNFGSIIRTCNFFGFDRIIITNKNCCHLSPVVSKASSGTLEISEIQKVKDFTAFLKEYKKRKWNIIGTSQHSKSGLHEFVSCGSSIVIFGNEGIGLSEETLNICDAVLSINAFSNKESKQVDCLNVNVAAGIILHHIKNTSSSIK